MALGARVFLICLVAVLVTAAGAVAALFLLGETVAPENPQERVLEGGYSAFVALERERYEQLALVAAVLADAPEVVAVLQATEDPIPAEVRATALDALSYRRWNLGLAVIQDADGRTLLRTDDPLEAGGRATVPPASVTGREDAIWYSDGRLYQTVTVPILPELAPPDAGIAGYLLVGRAVDDIWPQEIAKIGRTEVAFVASVRGGAQVVSKTLDDRLVMSLLGVLADGTDGPAPFDAVAQHGQIFARREIDLDGEPWILRLAPLRGSGDVSAAAVALLTPAGASGDGGPLLQLTAVGGAALAALLLVAPLAWAVGRSGRAPLRRLAALVNDVRGGAAGPADVRAAGRGAVAPLADALAGILSDREQRETLQAAVRTAVAGGRQDGRVPAPERPDLALLGVELRRHARSVEPEESMKRLEADLATLRRTVHAQGGGVQAVLGHRVLAVFQGDAAVRRGLAAAAQAMDALSAAQSAFDDPDPPVMALTTGKAVQGWVAEEDGRLQPIYLGLPAQLLETVMREAAPGEIYFSRDVHGALQEALATAGVEPVAQNAMLTPQPLYVLAPEVAVRVAGDTVAAPAASDTAPGAVLDHRFEIRSAEPEGPVAKNYRAFDRELGREVALKELRRSAVTSTDRLTALDSPLQAYRGFTHPQIARLFDYGTLESRPFLTREWVDGLPMGELLRRVERLAPVAALGAARQLAGAVAAAHRQGLTHLRLKPGNLLFGRDGALRLTDFGVAVVAPPLLDLEGGEGGAWMAPEQQSGDPGDARSDVYTCGLLIHRLFAGAPGSDDGPLPEAVRQIVARCRAAEPGQRYADAGELERALQAVVLS